MKDVWGETAVLKRIFDLILALFGLILLSPLLIVIAVVIKLDSEGPIFYRGVRTGKDGIPFKIYKFRTMVTNAEIIGGTSTAENDPRITRIGGILRKYKFDELPQLINVIKGDMSLVGPRPEVYEYTCMYDEEEQVILTVTPGITDYASIKFRNLNSILAAASTDPDEYYRDVIRPQKNMLRVKYVKEQGFYTDLKILFRTIGVLLRSDK